MHELGLHAAGEESSPQLTVTDQLCQSAAHDLRGILMAIQLSAEELTTPGSRVVELQAELLASIERATQLASELATLARPTSGHSEVFDVGLLIDQMQRMLRRNTPAGAVLRLELARDPCFVAVPRMTLKRILLTLFNSVAARQPPRSTLTIETAVTPEASVGDPESPRALVVVSVGGAASRAHDWREAIPVVGAETNAPGAEGLRALLQRLDAELYTAGDLESSPQFWLCLPRRKPIAGGSQPA